MSVGPPPPETVTNEEEEREEGDPISGMINLEEDSTGDEGLKVDIADDQVEEQEDGIDGNEEE